MKLDLTKQEKINELIQNLSSPINAQKIIVLVEGEDDYRLFKKLFHQSNCIIDFIPGGKTSLLEGLTAILQIHRKSIGIQDADFMHLETIENTTTNLFLTDFHDMEIVMLSQPEIYSALLHEHAPHIEKERHTAIFNQKLSELRFTSYLRFVNHIQDWQLNFQGISFAKAFNIQEIIIDNNRISELILSQSPNAQEKEINNIKAKISEMESPNHDILQLCNGHDLVKIIGLFIGVNDKNVAQKIRTSYRSADFERTKLYQNISKWAIARNIVVFEST